jgi:hypothetical protein
VKITHHIVDYLMGDCAQVKDLGFMLHQIADLEEQAYIRILNQTYS